MRARDKGVPAERDAAAAVAAEICHGRRAGLDYTRRASRGADGVAGRDLVSFTRHDFRLVLLRFFLFVSFFATAGISL
jgi:hypothetical protein